MRAAVVGASSDIGRLVRDALVEAGVPGTRVELFGTAAGEAVISEYGAEARLVQDPDLREITLHDVIFLCETGEVARRVAASARREALVVDVARCLAGATEAPLCLPGIGPEPEAGSGGYLSVPHPLAIVLAELLADVDRGPGVEQAVAVVLCPAADRGEAGIEELRDQTVRLLSFAELPTEVFGRQLAFNLLAGDVAAAERIGEEVARLLGWDRPRLTLSLVTAPIFHGHLIQLHVRTRSGDARKEVGEALAAGRHVSFVERLDVATPLDAPGGQRTIAAGPRDDGLGGCWIWAVAGEAGARAAVAAVTLARRVTGL